MKTLNKDPDDFSDEEVISLLKEKIELQHMWSLPEGWSGIVAWFGRRLLDRYDELNLIDGLTIYQVKQKFWTLRFYYSFNPGSITDNEELGEEMKKTVAALVRTIEAMSDITCEYCGSTIDVRVREKKWFMRKMCQNCFDNSTGES